MPSKHEYRTRDMFGAWDSCSVIYPMKFHRQVEICLVLEGELQLTMEEGDFLLKPGDLYVMFPNVLHAVDLSHVRKQLWMFSPELVPTLTETLLTQKPQCPVLRTGEVTELIRQLLRRCVKLYLQDKVSHRPLLLNHSASLMQELLLKLELVPWGMERGMIQKLTGFLMKHYRSDITLEHAAKELGYSKFYISHAILERFGCNFRTLVNRYRISAAQEALQSSDKSVGEICYDCGFVNLSTFNRAFLKICGMTPTQYRQTQSTK